MRYDHDECRTVLFRSLMNSLSTHADLVRSLEAKHRTPSRSGLCALSYDILPWQPFVGLSFCTASDNWPAVRWQPTEDLWTGYNLIGWHNAQEALAPALKYVHDAHLSDPDSRELYHLIFLAAADALLDPRVAELLQQCNIPAGVITDQIPVRASPKFEYVVVDEDGVFRGNYCEIICAHRVATKLLGREV